MTFPPTVLVNFWFSTFTGTLAVAPRDFPSDSSSELLLLHLHWNLRRRTLPSPQATVPVNFWFSTFTKTLAVAPSDLPSDSSSELLVLHLH